MTKTSDFDDKMNYSGDYKGNYSNYYSGDYSATGYARLAKSLIDIVKEQQAKLGYRKEIVRLYYPLSTLRHFFECAGADNKIATGMISEQQMLEILAPNNLPIALESALFASVGVCGVFRVASSTASVGKVSAESSATTLRPVSPSAAKAPHIITNRI